MIKLKEKMPLSLDGVTVTECKKGQIVDLDPSLEQKIIKSGAAEEVKEVIVTKSESTKKTGTKK